MRNILLILLLVFFLILRLVTEALRLVWAVLKVVSGYAIWPSETRLLNALDEEEWRCAHTVQKVIAENEQAKKSKINLRLVEIRLASAAKKGLAKVEEFPDSSCTHIPPCTELHYALSLSGKAKLKQKRVGFRQLALETA
jgi:hypothetical protein